MRLPTLAVSSLTALVALGLAACGGSGHGFGAPDQNISVPNNALPTAVSGQTINFQIPLDGGCGGPYTMSVIDGSLPPGLALDNPTRSIVGVILLPNSNYDFTIQIDDTGCTPFSSTTVHYQWNVTIGPVVIAACDPPFIPNANYNPPNTTKWNDIEALKTTVYGDFAVFNFTLAGGVPPYVFEIIDDPNDPNDVNWSPPPGAAPQGMSIPPFSHSFIGAPVQTGGGIPYRITFQVRDANNNAGTRKVQWKVDTPPIIVATLSLPNGKCGINYGQTIQIVDGVPPFNFELTDYFAYVDDGDYGPTPPAVTSTNPGPVTVDPLTGTATDRMVAPGCYPLPAAVGPFGTPANTVPGVVPEGVMMRDTLGQFTGIPRRAGAFTFHVHVCSSLVPNAFGQHKWHTYSNVTFAQSEQLPLVPPQVTYAYTSLNTWTQEGALFQPPLTPSGLPSFEMGVPYNPDGGTAGLSCIASGGVPKDGLTDAPHFSEALDVEGSGSPDPAHPDYVAPGPNGPWEFTGGYDWTVDWDPVGASTSQPPGIYVNRNTGVFTANEALLVSQGFQTIRLITTDQQLPTPTYPHSINTLVRLDVGPDKVIISESTTSYAPSQGGPGLNDHNQKLRVLEPTSTFPFLRDLDDGTDLTVTGLVPAAAPPGTGLGTTVPSIFTGSNFTDETTLSTLLTGIDIMRLTVNPTGYWDDNFGMSAQGARPFQHADPNRYYTYGSMSWQSAQNGVYNTWEPNASAVDLMPAVGVTTNASLGRFANGGRLYAFQSADRFGVFIVRKNADIYVPIAFDGPSAGGTYSGFGDAHLQPHGADIRSHQQMVQLTVSPNGRFAAMKLKTNTNVGQGSFQETADTTKIVVFSLTGEKVFDGNTEVFKIIGTGSNLSAGKGNYQYAQSLALTNRHLYYLCGNHTSTYSSWKEHAVYRYTLDSGAAAGALLANGNADWQSNVSIGTMLQTPFQLHDSTEEFYNGFLTQFTPTFSQSLVSTPFTSRDMYLNDGWNATETGLAPMPFRVSGDGSTCVIVAGKETGSTGSLTNQMLHHVWADTDTGGGPTFSKLSSIARHSPHGGGRGYALGRGPRNYRHWGTYTGPTTALEISHDALKVAIVVNRSTSLISPTSASNWYNAREDIVAFTRPTTAGAWTEVQISGVDVSGTPRFSTSYLWRFGSLIFTKDGNGLIFWAGTQEWPGTAADTKSYSCYVPGTYYSWKFSTSTLRSIFTQAEGGSNAGQVTTTSVNPAGYLTFNGTQGRIRPVGGFISKSRDFAYIMSLSALSASDNAANQLLGINIRGVDPTVVGDTINGRTAGNGFKLGSQPLRRGFSGEANPYPTTVLSQPTSFGQQDQGGYYAPGNATGAGQQVMARDTGYVFYASHYQRSGPTQNLAAQFTYQVPNGPSHPTYYGGEHAWGGHVEGFNAEVAGPVARMTSSSLTGDSVQRGIHYLEVHDSGRSLAFVMDTSGNVAGLATERVGMVQNISFDVSTGALQPGKVDILLQVLPPTVSVGRAGGSMCHDTTGRKLYVPFGLNSTNEAAKKIYEATTGSSAGPVPAPREVGSSEARYEVLYSGR